MDVHVAAGFFVGTILTCGGVVVIGLTAVLMNNVISKYWKPITWRVYDDYHYDFIEPTMDEPVANSNTHIVVTK